MISSADILPCRPKSGRKNSSCSVSSNNNNDPDRSPRRSHLNCIARRGIAAELVKFLRFGLSITILLLLGILGFVHGIMDPKSSSNDDVSLSSEMKGLKSCDNLSFTSELRAEREDRETDEDSTTGTLNRLGSNEVEDIISQYPLEELFPMHAKFGDSHNNGEVISLKNLEKWLKQAKIRIIQQDVSIHFTKVAKGKKSISYKDFLALLEKMSMEKQISLDTLKLKLILCGPPKPNNPTKFGGSGSVYERLTDKTKYTGVHKNKLGDLDRKSSKSKTSVYTGYVTGYKLAGSYDKNH